MSGSNIASIICGAPDGSIDRSLVEGLVICADKGMEHAAAAGITPHIVVGDFDSSAVLPPDGIECIRVSPIKDDTDAMLAANTAIERGCTVLRFFCALGGRFDHTFANVQMLQHLHERGIYAELYGGSERIRLLHEGDSVRIKRFEGFVSLFSYSAVAEVTETGMKYPLQHYTLDHGFPLGVSNEVAEEYGEIILHSGTAILCEYHGA